jgi:hypothetical protein
MSSPLITRHHLSLCGWLTHSPLTHAPLARVGMDEHGPKANGVGGTPPTRGPFKPFPGPPAQPAADADAERQGVKADHGQPSHRRSSSWDALQRRSPLQPHVAGSPPRNSSPPVQVPSPLVRAPTTSGCHAAALHPQQSSSSRSRAERHRLPSAHNRNRWLPTCGCFVCNLSFSKCYCARLSRCKCALGLLPLSSSLHTKRRAVSM